MRGPLVKLPYRRPATTGSVKRYSIGEHHRRAITIADNTWCCVSLAPTHQTRSGSSRGCRQNKRRRFFPTVPATLIRNSTTERRGVKLISRAGADPFHLHLHRIQTPCPSQSSSPAPDPGAPTNAPENMPGETRNRGEANAPRIISAVQRESTRRADHAYARFSLKRRFRGGERWNRQAAGSMVPQPRRAEYANPTRQRR